MKEYFHEKDDYAYIIDDKEGVLIRKTKDNIEEIFVVENNIEQIETEINNINEKKLERKTFLEMIVKRGKILTSLISVLMIFMLGTASTFLTLSQMLPVILFCIFTVGIFGIQEFNDRGIKKEIKSYEVYIKELEKELVKEKSKLYELESLANDKTVDSTIIKEIPKTEIVANLTRKKEIITDYIKSKKKYNSLYESGSLDNFLQSKGYNLKDVDFVKIIIQEELKQKEIDKICKQKIK